MAIEAAYEPTFQDFLAVNRWIVRRRWRVLWYLSALMIALFLASPFLFHDRAGESLLSPYARSLAVLMLPALFLVLLPLTLYAGARKRWKDAPEIREPRRFRFSEDGFAVEGGSFSGRVPWSHVTCAEFHRGLFILKTNRNVYHILSRRGIPDEADREAFVSLVRKKVSPTFGRRSVLGRIKFLEPGRSLDRA